MSNWNPGAFFFLGTERTVKRLMALDNRLWSWGPRGQAAAPWRVERLQVKAKGLLKVKLWTEVAHQVLRKSLLADMTAQGTVSTDAAQDGVVKVVVNDKMRAVRYCKDKMGIVSAAHLVELGPRERWTQSLWFWEVSWWVMVPPALCMHLSQGSRQPPFRRGSLSTSVYRVYPHTTTPGTASKEWKCHSPCCLCRRTGWQRFTETRFPRLITQTKTYISEAEFCFLLATSYHILLLTVEHQAVTFCGTHNHSMPNRCCTKGTSHDATDIGVQYIVVTQKTFYCWQ